MLPPLLLVAAIAAAASEAGSPPADPNAPPRRPPLSLKVFKNMEGPITGLWDLEIPQGAPRRLELKELVPGNSGVLVGVDPATGQELMRLERRKEGIGYAGQMLKVFSECGLETLAVSEFLPLGDAIVLRFETMPTENPCPALDGGGAGKFRVVSARGSAVRLRDLSEISDPEVRETYGIGGERQIGVTRHYLTGVTVEPGSEVRLRGRFRAPLDRSLWFEVEAVLTADPATAPPRGYVRGDALRLAGSLSLKRARQAD